MCIKFKSIYCFFLQSKNNVQQLVCFSYRTRCNTRQRGERESLDLSGKKEEHLGYLNSEAPAYSISFCYSSTQISFIQLATSLRELQHSAFVKLPPKESFTVSWVPSPTDRLLVHFLSGMTKLMIWWLLSLNTVSIKCFLGQRLQTKILAWTARLFSASKKKKHGLFCKRAP